MTLIRTSEKPRQQAATEPAVVVRGLVKRYKDLAAVDGIDFSVERGEVFGLIGPDGAGKTTTFQILAGVMEATAGEVTVLGRPPREARLKTGYLTQPFSLYLDLSIDENLSYSAGLRQVPKEQFEERRARYLKLMDLERFSARLAGQLSGGMKQKLALCAALVTQPEILLLDEPTTGVDPVSRREFWDVLAALAEQEQTTVIVATPYLDEAERCNRVALMHEGRFQKTDTPARLRADLGLVRLEVQPKRGTLDEAEHKLQRLAQIKDVQTFGDRLDVLVADADRGEQAVKDALKDQEPQIERTEPTLENVFVTRLRAAGSDPPFIAFPSAPAQRARAQSGVAIGAYDLGKTFGDFRAVHDVSLEVAPGQIYGLLGANGAGKTTTIKMLCGLLPASTGSVTLAGESGQLRSSALRSRLGYMSQKFTLYDDLSIEQNLEFYGGVYGVPRRLRRERIDWVIEICGLKGQENLTTGALPGGWKQRVAFGASVMHQPEVLFLDEPTSGVDPLARRQFWRLIEMFARTGTAVLVTTHYLEEAEHCHRLGFMVAGGLIAQGTPGEIKSQQPGQLFEVVPRDLRQATRSLRSLFKDQSWRVSLFGDRLHVVLDDGERHLDQLQALGQTRPIPYSLEDAFIGMVQRNR
ncbi:ATP-binding cassette domain-containing protein [Gloeobacter kilaueensis]|uniref:ABC transporter, ATP-binding protein n=1 Tax=Gloeobacter kilaueensis (strain ATCC BAA-2537 / CCAP 1431/1 / ULC 316 / JS1) TaxID=1183438 RepID=U5QF63_GLOK1|nr:ATP-binding cassette domain-containing protein [Gloeobacter kilaueensis]AGY57571.1 ABC transporter, ATP-binding protein [Gloeobacter kilaueensis JS1]